MPDQLLSDENGTVLNPDDIKRKLADSERSYAAVEQELATTKRLLGDAHRRCIELNEKEKRSLSAEAIDIVLEEAIARDRISSVDRDEWARKLQDDPSGAFILLARDREMTAAELEADTRRVALLAGLRPDQVL